MKNPVFELPTLEIVGGSTETFRWNLWHLSPEELENKDQPFNARGCIITFSLVGFSEKNERPDISRTCDLLLTPSGDANIAVITLTPEETRSLCGKYLYQLSIQDSVKDIEIVRQGVMYIWRNLNKSLFDSNEDIPYLRSK